MLQETAKLLSRKRNIQTVMFRTLIETCTVRGIAIMNRPVPETQVLGIAEMTDPLERRRRTARSVHPILFCFCCSGCWRSRVPNVLKTSNGIGTRSSVTSKFES